jgi:hypothetical protein
VASLSSAAGDLETEVRRRFRPLITWMLVSKTVLPAPHDPSSYPESDARRWHEYEYTGWAAVKLPQPRSCGGGPAGLPRSQ